MSIILQVTHSSYKKGMTESTTTHLHFMEYILHPGSGLMAINMGEWGISNGNQ
ncbi:MAG: hypothetical protein ABIL70_05215 [candidate division WOR-3 bacterium]